MASLLDLFVNVKVSGTGTVAGELAGISSQASKTDKAVGSSMRSIGSSMQRVGRGMSLFVTAPIALAGAAMVKMGAEFDQALTNAVSVTGKTGAAAEQAKNQMNDLALTLGAKTAFSAKDAADAMYDLASSGWSVNDMQKGLNGIMALAAATQTDLADATGTVTATLASFKMEAEDSGHVSDVFTAAINKSRLHMDDLAIGMKYAGPVAAGFGLSLEETTAALAEMADKGIEGSQAGTTLRAALSSLANPVGQAKDALIGMGVSMDEVNPQTHSLAEIMKTLGDAGMSTNDAIKLFGREAASGMIAVSSTGVPALEKLTAALKDSGGTAERTAKMQLNTLAGAWQNLSGSLETLAIKFEQQIEPALKGLLNALVPVVNSISEWPPAAKAAALGAAAFAAALGPLLIVVGTLITAAGVVATSIGAIASAAVVAAAALPALVAVGAALWKNWDKVAPALNSAVQKIKDVAQSGINFVADIFDIDLGFLEDKGKKAGDAFGKGVAKSKPDNYSHEFWSKVGKAFTDDGRITLGEVSQDVWDALLKKGWHGDPKDAREALLPPKKYLEQGGAIAADQTANAYQQEYSKRVPDATASAYAQVDKSGKIKEKAKYAGKIAADQTTNAYGQVLDKRVPDATASAYAQADKDPKVTGDGSAAFELGQAIAHWVIKGIQGGQKDTGIRPGWLNAILAPFDAANRFIDQFFKGVDKELSRHPDFVKGIANFLTNPIGHALKGIVNLVGKAVTNIFKLWGRLPDLLKAIAPTIIKVFTWPFRMLYNILVGNSIIPDLINSILKWFKNLLAWLKSPLKAISNLITDTWEAVRKATLDKYEAIRKTIADKLQAARNKAGEIVQDLKSGLSGAWDAIESGAAKAWEAIKQAMQNPIETAYNNIVDFINKIITVVNQVLKVFGQDPITLVSHAGGPSTPNSGQDRNNLQTGRHNALAFARGGTYQGPSGGLAKNGAVRVFGEAGDEAYVTLGRYTPQSADALMEANKIWTERGWMDRIGRYGNAGGRHMANGGLLRYFQSGGIYKVTPNNVYPLTWQIASDIASNFSYLNEPGTTYAGHGRDGDPKNSVDYQVAPWGTVAQGSQKSLGDSIVSHLMSKWKSDLEYLIWYGMANYGTHWQKYTGGGGYAYPTTPSGRHQDHVHMETNQGYGGGGISGGGTGTGPSLAELMWKMLSPLLPSVPSFGGGVVGSAASAYLNSYKGWIHDWLLSKFGGSGGISGGNSPKGLTILDAATRGGFSGDAARHAGAIIWRESSGNAHAHNASGARGLMQIMPATARGIGADYNKLYDPIYNTSAGHKLYMQSGWSPWNASNAAGLDYSHLNDPVTGYDYGGLIKRNHLALMHANELALPLDHPQTAPLVRTIAGTDAIERRLDNLTDALTERGIRVKDYGKDAEHVIVVGAREGGLGAMKSRDGKNITVATVNEVQRNKRLSGSLR